MSRELARAHLVGPIMESLLREIDFGRLQPGHLPRIEALCRQRLTQAANAAVRRQLGGDSALDGLARDLSAELLCTRLFFALLQDESVTALVALGPDRLDVERGARRESVEGAFPSEQSLRRIALWMSARGGRPAHEDDPRVRCTLPDGSELQVLLPPLTPGGCILSLRRPAPALGDLAGLALNAVVPSGLIPVLHALVTARLSLVVSGARAGARAAVVDALLTAVSPSDRVAVLDAGGLVARGRPDVIRMLPSAASPPAELLDAAARLRPDRLVACELNRESGPGFLDLAAATGSLGTLHAASPRDATDRLTAWAAEHLGEPAATRQVGSALAAVLHLSSRVDGRPVLSALTEVAGGDGEPIALHDVVRFHPRADGGGTFAGSGSRPGLAEVLEQRGHRLPATTWRLQQSVG